MCVMCSDVFVCVCNRYVSSIVWHVVVCAVWLAAANRVWCMWWFMVGKLLGNACQVGYGDGCGVCDVSYGAV